MDFSTAAIPPQIKQLRAPVASSHKGQNGKLLIIGGSELFHAASKWSLDVAAHLVDMVFYSSTNENNQLIQQVKQMFWDGIVVPRSKIAPYIDEADCVLIGPGMERSAETSALVNQLLTSYPLKKWVIDAGALQVGDPSLFTSSCILTPHHQEMTLLPINRWIDGATSPLILQKGPVDELKKGNQQLATIAGGSVGLTKGGTGDVLAGLISALYCTQNQEVAAIIGSWVNKKAAEELGETVGPYFSTTELALQVPKTLWAAIQSAQSVSNGSTSND